MRTTVEGVAGEEAATPHEMSKWGTYEFQRRTLTLRVQTRFSTKQPLHLHSARRRQRAQSWRRVKYRKMRSGRTTLAEASLTRSHPRHKRNLPRSAVLGVADAAAHAIDGKKNARGTLPRLVNQVVSA
jgi:hypothetical protein